MISEELRDTIDAIDRATESFDVDGEKSVLDKIEKFKSDAFESRNRRAELDHQILQELTMSVAATEESLKSSKTPKSAQHTTTMKKYETEKLSTTNRISELQNTVQGLEEENERLRQEIARLDEEEARENRLAMADPTMIKLAIYKSLDVEFKQNKEGEFDQCRIVQKSKNDIKLHQLDPSYSQFFHANYIWDTLVI
ncbi:kinetochore-associated Ndc80 complex subunit spc24 [Nowakowskiella sp. JEL0407]|nr:kinetochore-associated Ndc80 complex subunit spc24 [Nowakowskiella sp. JEL0407]